MNLVPASAAQTLAKTVMKGKKNSPHIFFGIGLVGAIGSVYLACRATLKLEETLEEIRSEVDEANEKAVDIVHSVDVLTPELIDNAERERAKEVSVVTVKGVATLGKLYGPAIVLGSVSVACLAGSHVQLSRRNAALTAAFTALSKAYDDYRERVRAEIGAEKERDIYRAIETHEIKDENGKKQLVRAVNPDGLSIYARVYDETNPEWKNNPEFNRMVLQVKEQWANHKLEREGFLFLNEVYETLGFEKSQAGQFVGWLKNSEVGDNHVDFGLFEARNSRHLNALEPSVWLDFNVDGPIWDHLP